MGNQEKKEENLASSTSVQLDIRDILQQLGISETRLPYDLSAQDQHKRENPR